MYLGLISLATLFLGIGYAQVSGIELGMNVLASAEVQEGVFISNVEYYESNNTDIENSTMKNYFATTLHSTVVLSESDNTPSYTYQITVYNNSNDDYTFVGTIYREDFYSNENITYTVDNSMIENKTTVSSKSSLTFYITFSYLDNVLADNNTLEPYINFQFEIKSIPSLVEYIVSLYNDGNEEIVDDETKDKNLRYIGTAQVTMCISTVKITIIQVVILVSYGE